MKKFKELINELEEKKTMSLAQRKKAAQRMKKMAKTSSFKTKVAKKARKIASPQDLLKRACLLYTSPSPRDKRQSRMPSSA